MRTDALVPYEQALLASSPLALHTDDGQVIALDIFRWLAPVDTADETVLARCIGPVLDVGCGPGRFVRWLAERGVATLGVDIAETAVELAQRRGAPALFRNVFDPVPGEGRWRTVLLMDGNIGIGGDPARLLRRVSGLLAAGGRLIVETDPDAGIDEILVVRFSQCGVAVGPQFEWARVGLLAVLRYACSDGYTSSEVWEAGGRTFVTLTR